MLKSIPQKRNKTTELPYTTILIMTLGGVSGIGIYFAVISEYWIQVLPSIIALYISVIFIVDANQKIAKMRKIFGRYLTNEVATILLETPEGLQLGGKERVVTLLFCDLRGFSVLSEQIPPEKIAEITSLYLEVMTKIIYKYEGTINNFMGDGIFVMFGAPIAMMDAQEQAVSCAIAMQLAMDDINNKLIPSGIPLLGMGISIHTGNMFAGNVGSQLYAKYTVMGSSVNLVFSIEKYTVGGQILISSDILKSIQELLRVDGEMQVQPKGTKESITIYEIGGIGGKYNLYLPQRAETLIALKQEIPLQFRVVKDKHLSEKVYRGNVVKISDTSAQIYSHEPVEILSNIKIDFYRKDETLILTDVYAKVVKILDNSNHFYIRFTSVPSSFKLFAESVSKT
ncbi:MAG: adenylate/guanylate cyclase domain-containing protein [Scytonematopsis contorta HA4267-MV1]|jgi:adenylate cyclase|nr:adenylate/guanylate cyclase domain-containing protein [Scytonematopsis contorta HA4267-MV1]